MYHPRGTDYVLSSVGIISLKRLANVNESYGGILHMRSLRDGCLFATIEYDININNKMINALILQKVSNKLLINYYYLLIIRNISFRSKIFKNYYL